MLFHVIDDQPIICEFMSSIFHDMGHETRVFNSPVAYLNFLGSDEYTAPAAVFSDVSMPLMSGYEMIRRVMIEHPDQKFIVISGKPEIQDEYRNYACMFLNKPFAVEDLEEIIESLGLQEAA